MSRFYKIRQIGPIMILERLAYPRLRIFISLEKGLPQVVKLHLLEDCPAADIARIIRHINSYLIRYAERIEPLAR